MLRRIVGGLLFFLSVMAVAGPHLIRMVDWVGRLALVSDALAFVERLERTSAGSGLGLALYYLLGAALLAVGLALLVGMGRAVKSRNWAIKYESSGDNKVTGQKSSAIWIGGNTKGLKVEGNRIIGADEILHVEGNAEDTSVTDNVHIRPQPRPVPEDELRRLQGVLQAISAEHKARTGEAIPDEEALNRELSARGEKWRMRHVGGDHWEANLF